MMKLKIRLVFDRWAKWSPGGPERDLSQTQEGVELSAGDFHSGTTFPAEVELDSENALELQKDLNMGYRPYFVMVPDENIVTKDQEDVVRLLYLIDLCKAHKIYLEIRPDGDVSWFQGPHGETFVAVDVAIEHIESMVAKHNPEGGR